jgi:predicted peptidase
MPVIHDEVRTDMTILCLAVAIAAASQDAVDGFAARSFTAANGDTMPYRLFVPDAGARRERLPLILYLHGGGGVGTDNRKQISGGNTAGTHTWTTPEAQRAHPAFVLAPQRPENRLGQSPGANGWSRFADAVVELVADISREFAIDPDRIYVTGQSMGGYGTWDLIARRPDLFAAAVPLCGGGDASRIGAIRKLPVWAFHGADDPVVPVTESRDIVAALRRAGSPVKYTEYPEVGHDVWTRAYAERELADWLFSQRRPRPAGK